VTGHGPKPDLPSPKQTAVTKVSLQPEAVWLQLNQDTSEVSELSK
jgi:hypothetical protein